MFTQQLYASFEKVGINRAINDEETRIRQIVQGSDKGNGRNAIFQKLTVKEIEEWKGPIQYVAHHAVVRP